MTSRIEAVGHGVRDTQYLIVNADDIGQSEGINDGVIRCNEQGIVTSASLMVRWRNAAAAATYARANPRLGVGLHIDLGERIFQDGEWLQLYSVPTGPMRGREG